MSTADKRLDDLTRLEHGIYCLAKMATIAATLSDGAREEQHDGIAVTVFGKETAELLLFAINDVQVRAEALRSQFLAAGT